MKSSWSPASFCFPLTFGLPTRAAIIPTAATTADELTAAITTAGGLVGLLLAGATLSVASRGAVLVWIGALGLTPDDTLARLFGVLEALESIGLALGGAAPSVLAVQTSVATAFAVVGGAGIVGPALMWRRLASIDRARRAVDPELLRIARSTAIFSPLPPYAMEQVMNDMVPETFDTGEALMTVGDDGDRMCLLTDSSVEVDTRNGEVIRCGQGVVLGEIALLRDVPRTATVMAGADGATVYWMDADSFLDAVNRVPRSRARADAEACRWLAQ